MSKPIITIMRSSDEESFRVLVGDVEVGYADHDSDGWSGMNSLFKTMKKTAKAIGYKFVEDYEEDTEE